MPPHGSHHRSRSPDDVPTAAPLDRGRAALAVLCVRSERSCPDRSCDPVDPLISLPSVTPVGAELPERIRADASEAGMIATTLAAGLIFACTPVRVWDGDGPIWCAEGPKVRLAGIAAREMDGSCRPGHPCPSAPAVTARDRLVRLLGGARGRAPEGHVLVRGPTLGCLSTGSAGGARTAAWCSSPRTGDLSCAMVRTGAVLRWKRYWRDHQCSRSFVEH